MSAGGPSWPMRLPFPWLLALRYLKSTRRDAYVTFLSVLAAGGIALGVAALLVVLAALSGLQHFLRRDVLSRTPHLEIELPPETAAADLVGRVASQPGVEAAHRILRGRGWLRAGGRVTPVEVLGFEGRLPHFFPDARGEGEGVWIGDLVAASWGLEVGDLVDLVSPRPTLTPFGPQPTVRQLRIAGTYRTGRTEDGERRLAVPLAAAERLFGDRQGRIEVRGARLEDAPELARRLAPILPPGSRVLTWQDFNRPLFFALRLEKALMFVSVFLIVPVAAMALITVMALLVSSKRGEIGMLQAMGATPADVRRAFRLLGTLLAGLGLGLGVGLGLGAAVLLDRFHLVKPPGDVYFIDHVPFRIEPFDLLAVVGATLVLTTLSTLVAARRAASLGTVEALGR